MPEGHTFRASFGTKSRIIKIGIALYELDAYNLQCTKWLDGRETNVTE